MPNKKKWLNNKKVCEITQFAHAHTHALSMQLGPKILKKHRSYGGPTLSKYSKDDGSPDHELYQRAYVQFMQSMRKKFNQICRTKKMYGYVYFPVELKVRQKRAVRKSKKFAAQKRIFAVGRDYVMLLDPKDYRKVKMEHHYQEIHQWQGKTRPC